MQKTNVPSISKSMPSDVEKMLGLDGLFEGDIVHLSFDCPRNLRTAFNSESKANGTSTCKNLQHFMASYVAVSRTKKHALGNTLAKLVDVPFVIENLNFEQYVQSKPRRLLRPEKSSKGAKVLSREELAERRILTEKEWFFSEVVRQWNLPRDDVAKWRKQKFNEAIEWKGRVSAAQKVLDLASPEVVVE